MIRIIFAVLAIGVLLAATVSLAATPDSSGPTIVQLKRQITQQKNKIGDLNDEIDAQDAALEDQSDTISRLRARIANWPDPLDVITARDPDGLWAAMRAIYAVFPATPGTLCGYDKSAGGSDLGITLDSFTFYRWSNC